MGAADGRGRTATETLLSYVIEAPFASGVRPLPLSLAVSVTVTKLLWQERSNGGEDEERKSAA